MTASVCLLEVCVDSAASLQAALDGGADRIELCSALSLSGLTPSPGFMLRAARQPLPAYAMIRPRAGDFCFSPAEIDMMRHDIDAARGAGLAGVALGATRPDGMPDEAALGRLVAHAKGLGLTLHRAFDVAPAPLAALDLAIALGFERVLTSGGATSALAGAPQIRGLVAHAEGRISIMAGAGITAANVTSLVGATGVTEVHGSFSRKLPAVPGPKALSTLGFTADRLETDADAVATARAALGR